MANTPVYKTVSCFWAPFEGNLGLGVSIGPHEISTAKNDSQFLQTQDSFASKCVCRAYLLISDLGPHAVCKLQVRMSSTGTGTYF